MAKNPIQFQKGLSLTDFLAQYGTEEQCRAALIEARWREAFAVRSAAASGRPGWPGASFSSARIAAAGIRRVSPPGRSFTARGSA